LGGKWAHCNQNPKVFVVIRLNAKLPKWQFWGDFGADAMPEIHLPFDGIFFVLINVLINQEGGKTMKRFGSLLLAAVMGSAITVAINGWMPKEDESPRIERVTTVPTSQVGFTVNENGEAVPLDFTGTAEKVTAAVVHIRAKSESSSTAQRTDDPFEFFFGPSPRQQGPSMSSGSGVIISKDGYIVTNNHVVESADELEVTLFNNRHYRAEVIGTDPDTDLALVKIDRKDLPALSFVNSDNVKVGEWVLAVGNPFNLNSTVTAGIISAKGRNIGIIGGNRIDPRDPAARTAIESFIQTDAAINPGNSGGALVNLNGDLIGINTAIASQTGSYAGYGFAVPANIVSKIVEDLMAYGTVQRGWLGITVGTVEPEIAKRYDLSVEEGAVVSGFAESNSAAKDAGIKEGDVIVKLDNHNITSSTQLIEYVGTKRPGDKISVTIDRKGKQVIVPVTLRNREGNEEVVKRETRSGVASLGLNLEDLDAKELKDLELKNGVRVRDLANGKVAKYTDMREGFIITQVDGKPATSAKQVNDLLGKKSPGETIMFSGVYENFSREYIYALRM
jgi:serine protease Do